MVKPLFRVFRVEAGGNGRMRRRSRLGGSSERLLASPQLLRPDLVRTPRPREVEPTVVALLEQVGQRLGFDAEHRLEVMNANRKVRQIYIHERVDRVELDRRASEGYEPAD
jgi:hypothetical protein